MFIINGMDKCKNRGYSSIAVVFPDICPDAVLDMYVSGASPW